MKTVEKSFFNTKITLASSVLAAVACISIAAETHFMKHETSAPLLVKNDMMNVVVIKGERMSSEQKLAYDLAVQEASTASAIVVIHAKRLNAEEKLQMDRQAIVLQAQNSLTINRPKKNG